MGKSLVIHLANRKWTVRFYEKPSFGGGRVAGGLSYSSDASFIFQLGEGKSSRPFTLSAQVMAQVPNWLVRRMRESATKTMTLHEDNWTGARLSTRYGTCQMSERSVRHLAKAFAATNPIWRLQEDSEASVLEAAGLL